MKKIETTSFLLHIIAMLFMLSDHLWATFFGTQRWMTGIGRIAFPIFAFLIVEGFVYTSNVKKYMQRLLIFAIISEIPFNMLMSGGLIGPFHQNVLWTFLLGLLFICLMEKAKGLVLKLASKIMTETVKRIVTYVLLVVVYAGISGLAYMVGLITFVDYFGAGVLTVLVFYVLRGKQWWKMLLQLICLYYINAELLAGMYTNISVMGYNIEFPEQGLAVLALIPIWLYSGNQGYHSKGFKYFCYAFYPAHMLILSLLCRL